MPNIYLTGMMGSGKSVTGKKLASFLKMGFADLDDLIQEKTKLAINDIFEKRGEAFFREQENLVIKDVAGHLHPRVVATGGGTILRPDNVERMRETGKIIYLEASVEILWDRVKNKKDRPLLKSGDPRQALEEIFSQRKALYEQTCDVKVNTDGQTADAVAKKILEFLEK